MTEKPFNPLDPKNVCTDMLARLQSKIPSAGLPTYGAKPAATTQERMADLEEQMKILQSKFKDRLEIPLVAEEPASVKEKQAAEEISQKLQAVVDKFNEDLTKWYEQTGCVANFGWSYAGGKTLEITAIDYIVYRKAPPSEKTLKDILASKPDVTPDTP